MVMMTSVAKAIRWILGLMKITASDHANTLEMKIEIKN